MSPNRFLLTNTDRPRRLMHLNGGNKGASAFIRLPEYPCLGLAVLLCPFQYERQGAPGHIALEYLQRSDVDQHFVLGIEA